ncbi:MarR family transcriptional regulator [Cryptosporangium minutisporangium]|uniref:MarR family winged helix-turn-helix transcriptional regulator n=1 Tax=Cryptosporangium minutisporangium TaxID=113569 RepID=A0ABP6SZM8_9ACTN
MELDWAVHHFAAAAAELDAAMAHRMSLTAGDFLALKHLLVTDEPVGSVELGRRLGITSGAATGLVDRLEAAGYAQRRPHPRDRRRRIVTVTRRAEDDIVRELRPLAEEISHLATGLTADQRQVVSEVLAQLATLHRHYARGR